MATYVPVLNVADKASSSVAVGRNGEVAVAWGEQVGAAGKRRSQRYRVAIGSARRGFSRPVTLAYGGGGRGTGAHTVKLAFGGAGELVAVYATRRGLEARVRPRGARRFTSATVLGPRDDFVSIATAETVDGRVVVAWLTRDYGEAVDNRYSVRVATQQRVGRFTRGQLLDRGPLSVGGPVEVKAAASGDGLITVAWTGFTTDLGPRTVRASTGRAGDSFAPFTEIADGGFGDVVGAAKGTVLLWREWAGPLLAGPGAAAPGYRVHAALRPEETAEFGAPLAITGIEVWSTSWASDDPAGAVHPRTGEVVVVWAAARATSGSRPRRARDSAVVRIARAHSTTIASG